MNKSSGRIIISMTSSYVRKRMIIVCVIVWRCENEEEFGERKIGRIMHIKIKLEL